MYLLNRRSNLAVAAKLLAFGSIRQRGKFRDTEPDGTLHIKSVSSIHIARQWLRTNEHGGHFVQFSSKRNNDPAQFLTS